MNDTVTQKAIECLIKIFCFEANVWHLEDKNDKLPNGITAEEVDKISAMRDSLAHNIKGVYNIKFIIKEIFFPRSEDIEYIVKTFELPSFITSLEILIKFFILLEEKKAISAMPSIYENEITTINIGNIIQDQINKIDKISELLVKFNLPFIPFDSAIKLQY